MWAQLIKTRLKADKEAELSQLIDALKAAEDPDSGFIRSTTMRDQQDPLTVYTLVMFDSEESARGREQDPARQERLGPIRALMTEIFDGPPEFVDLTVIAESGP